MKTKTNSNVQHPFVSVIITVYNGEKYIEQSVKAYWSKPIKILN